MTCDSHPRLCYLGEGDDLFTLGSFGRGQGIVSGSYDVDEGAEGAGASNGQVNGADVDPHGKQTKDTSNIKTTPIDAHPNYYTLKLKPIAVYCRPIKIKNK